MQAKQSGAAPVMIRIEKDAGHGAGTPTEKIIDQYADLFAFTLANMGTRGDVAGLHLGDALNPCQDIAYGHIDGFFAVEPRLFRQLRSGN